MTQATIALHHSAVWKSDYRWFNGGNVTPVMAEILEVCARESGWGTIRLSQGGLSSAVAASGQTHVGLDVADIAIDGRSKRRVWRLSAALKRSGILAFPRGFVADSFESNKHIHVVRFPATHAHRDAKAQVDEYLNSGGDGLIGDAHYTGPHVKLDQWADSPYNPDNIKARKETFFVDVEPGSTLMGLDVDRRDRQLHRSRGFKVNSVKRVHRWGRWNAVTRWGTFYAMEFLTEAKP